jgi:DNA-binding NarL/FixJ family response regulator
MDRPVSVALVNDYELVVRGLAAMLEPYRDRVEVVECDIGQNGPRRELDVALIDTFGMRDQGLTEAKQIRTDTPARFVVIYTWEATGDLCRRAVEAGLSGVIAKSTPARGVVDALERAAAGEVVAVEGSPNARRSAGFDPPGPLSERETEVLVLLAQGLTNRQIADALYLSPETVKTYVSRLYAKLGVTNRASAVVWAMERDLGPPLRSPRPLLGSPLGNATPAGA